MKKVLWSLGLLVVLLVGALFVMKQKVPALRGLFDNHIYINAAQSAPNTAAEKLKEALEHEGRKVSLSYNDEHKSGEFNLYLAEDIYHLPVVADKTAINFLWLDRLEDGTSPEPLRAFDVIVVKTIPAFSYLKAINVRTAFIPDAIDIKKVTSDINGKAMFYGDGNVYSLSLAMAGAEQLSLDVFGKNFEGKWPQDELKGDVPILNDIEKYSLVLVDQADEDIRDNFAAAQVISILERGGLPYIRYNPAFEKLFGEAVPMYYNEPEFKPKLEGLLSHPEELMERREAIFNIAKEWSSHMQAKKFIELFEVMERKHH